MSKIEIALTNIPGALKARPQWVNWQYRTRQGKRTKGPMTVAGEYASVRDPKTWATFDEVIREGRPIGYVFSEDDPFVGIDLDHCRNLDSGMIEPWAWAIGKHMNSYTELSPSKTGFHIIITASLVGSGRRTAGLEIYSNARFFCVSGWHVAGTTGTIEPRQVEVDELVRERWGEGRQVGREVDPTIPPVSLSDDQLRLALIEAATP